jgi:transcriptional regulator with XRE-family HTH domain
MSRERLAEQIGRSKGWLLKVENGRSDPQHSDLVLLAERLGVDVGKFFTDDDDGISPYRRHAVGTRTIAEPVTPTCKPSTLEAHAPLTDPAPGEWSAEMWREAFLHAISIGPGAAAAAAWWLARPGPELLDGLAVMTKNYLQLHNTVSPAAVRPAICHHFDQLILALHFGSPSAGARIRSMAAQTAILAGWVSFNLQDVSRALMYWSVAHELAREAGNVSLQAHALGARSRLYSPIHRGPDEADPGAALALLDQGVQLAQRAASPALRSWLLANRAQQLAATSQADASYRDLDAAAHFASLGEQADEDVLSGWDEVRVDAYRGICAMVLQRPAEVIAVTESVLARTDPARVQRSLQQCDLAAAYAMQGDVDHAAGLLREALAIANGANFPEGVQRVRGVRARYLVGHDLPAVSELDELIASYGS